MFANNQISTTPKCPYCTSIKTTKRARLKALGYATFHCHQCGRNFNERTGSPYNCRLSRTRDLEAAKALTYVLTEPGLLILAELRLKDLFH